MDSSDGLSLLGKASELWHENRPLFVMLFIVCITGFVSLSFFLYSAQESDSKVLIVDKINKEPLRLRNITIDIEGAVKSPGIYKISDGSRISDAISSARGLSERADARYIQKNINLAMPLKDGQKIYIPFVGEDSGTSAVLGTKEGSQQSHISINTASASELDGLAGVGKITADKIIRGRPYTSIEELIERKIVSKKVFEAIKDEIVVD